MKKSIRLSDAPILKKIHLVRNQKVMFDFDLALLYEVETKYLKRQVKRNISRFPKDFMFTLTKQEIKNLRCQFGTSSWGGLRYSPMAFTEQGVAMLSSVLNSDRAISVNIKIIRIFTRLREMLFSHKDFLMKLSKVEKKLLKHDADIKIVFTALRRLLQPASTTRAAIGYKIPNKD